MRHIAKSTAEVSVGIGIVATAVWGRLQRLALKSGEIPFILANGLSVGMLEGLEEQEQLVLNPAALAKVVQNAGDALKDTPSHVRSALETVQKDFAEAYEKQLEGAKKFDKKIKDSLSQGKGNDFLVFPKHEMLGLDRRMKHMVRQEGPKQAWSISNAPYLLLEKLDKTSLVITSGVSAVLVGTDKVCRNVGRCIGKCFSKQGKGLLKSTGEHVLIGLYLSREVVRSITSVVVGVSYNIAVPFVAGIVDAVYAAPESVERNIAEATSRVTIEDAKTFAKLSWKDFNTAYEKAKKKFTKYDEVLKAGDMEKLLKAAPHKVKKYSDLKGRGVLLKKFPWLAEKIAEVQASLYAFRALSAKGSYLAGEKSTHAVKHAGKKAVSFAQRFHKHETTDQHVQTEQQKPKSPRSPGRGITEG